MNYLEIITNLHHDDIDKLNARIEARLGTASPLMSKIILSLLRTKGKQIRPLLLMMCAKLFGASGNKMYAAAAAIELIHNASLIHDDVVDNSPVRRGRPTVNAVWDNHIAVLVGDYFTSSAMNEAIATGDIRIIDTLCALGRDLSLGEIDQIYSARQHTLSEDDYFHIIDYKTASLFVASARMGCLVAGAPADKTEALARFALLFGRCFQLRDDIFDYYDADTVGKPTGNDLREGKVTLPLLKALETGAPGCEAIRAMLEKDMLTDEEIEVIQRFARDNGGIDSTYAVMNDLRKQAFEQLALIDDDETIRQQLAELFDFVIARKF
mgnify:FL=1